MKSRGQGTTEYLIFTGALLAFLYGFFISGFPSVRMCDRFRNGVWVQEPCGIIWGAPPLTTALMSIIRRPSELVADQVLDTTRLDIYPAGTPGGRGDGGTFWHNFANFGISGVPGNHWQYGFWQGACPPGSILNGSGQPIDTCAAMETGTNPADTEITDCDPAANGNTGTYTCNEYWCTPVPDNLCGLAGMTPPCFRTAWSIKDCVNGLLSNFPEMDDCPGTDRIKPYLCQPEEDMSCNDVFFSTTFNSAGQTLFSFIQRTITCTPICCPS